jgi:hypothetical protein
MKPREIVECVLRDSCRATSTKRVFVCDMYVDHGSSQTNSLTRTLIQHNDIVTYLDLQRRVLAGHGQCAAAAAAAVMRNVGARDSQRCKGTRCLNHSGGDCCYYCAQGERGLDRH